MIIDFNLVFNLVLSVTIMCFCLRTRAELYTALVHLELLIETHVRVMQSLQSYVNRENEKMKFLSKYLERMKADEVRLDSDYYRNPMNTFRIIKMLTIDLDYLENKTILDETEFLRNSSLLFPNKEDVEGVSKVLTVIQTTYELKVIDLANGLLNGTPSTPMSSSDCYSVAVSLFKLKEFKQGVKWMTVAHKKYKKIHQELYNLSEENIIEHISYAYHSLKNYAKALFWLEKLMTMLPYRDARFMKHMETIQYYEDQLNDKNHKVLDPDEVVSKSKRKKKSAIEEESHTREILYKRLCQSPTRYYKDKGKYTKRLHCQYLKDTHPFLKLAPIKMEQLSLKPGIFFFHDVLHDREIEQIKNASIPKLQRASVVDGIKQLVASFRVGKTARVENLESVSQRIMQFTGLSLESVEHLAVTTYGVGGHYEPHTDVIEEEEIGRKRYATVLFYMSEVEQGGATVFTHPGLMVKPAKGGALYWTNLFPSGALDLGTLHAACPVLLGDKWVVVAWVPVAGQELLKPCLRI